MKIAVFAYSRRGCQTAQRIVGLLYKEECRAYTMERFLAALEGFSPIRKPSVSFYGEQFLWADALIFVGSCGIAVRGIAPHVKDKTTDPAVLCVDELGTYVIPLLSGHIGGANELARKLAVDLKAIPVITTATDINHRFSVDTWAVKNGFAIGSMKASKMVSAKILEAAVPLVSDFPIVGTLPAGVIQGSAVYRRCPEAEVGIYITWKRIKPFGETLSLFPRVLHLGIGCRKGTDTAVIREVVNQVFLDNQIDQRAVCCVASIDLKANERGLLEFCEGNKWPVKFYSAKELQAVEGEFTPSEFVQNITGVDNVCERAALIGAKELLVKKTAMCGVTVAVALEELEVCFE